LNLTSYAEAQASIDSQAQTGSGCQNSDPDVAVLGAAPLTACVESTGSGTELYLFDPTSTAYSISNCTGDLPSGCQSDSPVGERGELDPGVPAYFSYDVTRGAGPSQLTFTPNLGYTISWSVVGQFAARFLGESPASVAQVQYCDREHDNNGEPTPVIIATCVVQSAGAIVIGGLHLGALAIVTVASLASDFLHKHTPALDPGGTLMLVSELPAAGSAGNPPAPSPPAYYVYYVQGTCYDGACGLHERTGPGYSTYASVGTLYDGDAVDVVCQAMGELVGPGRDGLSSAVWDKLTSGAWVSDYYISTPDVGTFSTPIPQC
jgi:hypothetical protein